MQPAGSCRHRQRVFRQREMVDADRLIACRDERVRRRFRLRAPLDRTGQRRLVDQPLLLRHPRHVRITEQRDSVGPHLHALPDRSLERLDRLVRQTVDQVEIDTTDPGASQSLDRAPHHVWRLDAVDRGLHLFVELLNPEACPVEPDHADPLDHFIAERARIAFDGDFRVIRVVEAARDFLHNPLEVVRLQRRRRPTAPVQMVDLHARGQDTGDEVDLPRQHVDILLDRLVARGELHVATAIPAKLPAERHVEIERHRLVRIEGAQPAPQRLFREILLEMRHRRIARVSRYRRRRVLLNDRVHPLQPPSNRCPLNLTQSCVLQLDPDQGRVLLDPPHSLGVSSGSGYNCPGTICAPTIARPRLPAND